MYVVRQRKGGTKVINPNVGISPEQQEDGHSFIETGALIATGPAEQLFIAGISGFEITDFEPPLQRVTIVGINLPDPEVFGPYDAYEAVILDPEQGVVTEFQLSPVPDQRLWAGATFLTFGGTLFPMTGIVRPIALAGNLTGPTILEGTIFE